MKDQINTIRRAVEAALSDDQPYIEACKQALTALTQLEAMVWEPVAWAMPKGDGTFIDVITPAEHARDEGSYTVPLFAHPVAQQPQAEARQSDIFCGVDFADGVLAVSVLRRRPDDVAELLHSEQIELPVSAAPQQAEAVPSDVVRDAERYRWLRDQTTDDGIAIVMKNKCIDDSISYPENINKHIDAAIAQQKGANHG